MKSTGIARKVDELGRIVLPKELRDAFNIKGGAKGTGDPLEIYTDEGNIILKKYTPGCQCGETKGLIESNGIKICQKCLKELNEHNDLINKARGLEG